MKIFKSLPPANPHKWFITRINSQDMQYSDNYIWQWYYGYGFMDDYGNYIETYNPFHPLLNQFPNRNTKG